MQDPIWLAGGNPTLYGYVGNSNTQVDVFGLMIINPNNVFFSQNNISSFFSNGSPVQDLVDAIKENPSIAKNFDDPIRIMKLEDLPTNVQNRLISKGAQSGNIFSLDNRRLYSAQAGGADGINAWFVTQSDLIEEARIKGVKPINLNRRFTTDNAGRSIDIRCN